MGWLWVLFAHYMGDYGLQSDWMSDNKHRPYVLFAHAVIWTGCVCVALQYLGLLVPWKVGFLLVGHMASDAVRRPEHKSHRTIDQLWHIIQCLIVYVGG